MKVKNIVFSGVMAAILGATGANAAINVASQGYVDSKVAKDVSALETTVSETYQTKADAETAATEVAQALAEKANKGTTLEAYGITDAYTTTEADEKFMIMKDATALGTNLQWTTDGKLDTKDIATADGLSNLTNTVNALSGVVNGDAETEGTVANKIATALNDYSTTEEMDTAIATATENMAKTSDVATAKQEAIDAAGLAADTKISTALADYTTTGDLTTTLNSYATTEALNGVKATAEAAATKTYVDTEFAKYTTTDALNTKLNDYATTTALKAEEDARKAADEATTEALKAYTKTADLDAGFVTEEEMTEFKTENTDAINAKVAQSDYNTKVAALEAKDTELANALATKITAPAACEKQDCVLSINKATNTITWVPLTEPVADYLNN